MRRGIWVGSFVVAVLGAALLWPRAVPLTLDLDLRLAMRAPRLPRDAERLPAWAVPHGLKTREVRGVVVDEADTPVAGARVRWATPYDEALDRLGGEAVTDREGRFDAGPQLVAPLRVVASGDRHQAVETHLDLRDPTLDVSALRIVLPPCEASFTLEIVDSGGGPVEHATVHAPFGLELARASRVTLCGRRGDPLTVRAAGYGASTVHPKGGELRVALAPEGVITGHVRDERGAPIAEAHVWTAPPYARALTDADGVYQLSGLPAGPVRVLALSDDAMACRAARVEIRPTAVHTVDFTLVRGATVTGRLVDDRGNPVPGESVGFVRGADRCSSRRDVSDGDGRFRVTHVPSGEVTPSGSIVPRTLSITGDLDGVTLVHRPPTRLLGRVTKDGQPVEADVTLTLGPRVIERTRSAADGRFVLRAPQRQGRIAASTEDALTVSQFVRLDTTEDKFVELVLEDGVSLDGLVHDRAGQPVAGARVVHPSTLGESVTDGTGRFHLGPVRAEDTKVTVLRGHDARPYPILYPAYGVLDPDLDARIIVETARHSVKGRVVGTEDLEVTLDFTRRTWVGPDGEFVFDDVPPGRYVLSAGTGKARLDRMIDVPQTSELVLDP